jgi:adenylate kinase
VLLADKLGGRAISSGAIFRARGDARIAKIMATGVTIPSEDFERMVREEINEIPHTTPLVLDGMAQQGVHEVAMVDDILAFNGRRIELVIELECGLETIMQRILARQQETGTVRDDDDPEVQAIRQKRFAEETQPSLDLFASRGLLVKVDGEGTRVHVAELVWNEVLKRVLAPST